MFWEKQELGEGRFPSGEVGKSGVGEAVPGELGLRVPHSCSPSRDGDGDGAPEETTAAKMQLEMGFWEGNINF